MIAIAVGAIAPYVLSGRVYFLEPFILPLMYCCYGGLLPVNAAAAVDFWGTKNAGANYGMLYSAWAAALILAPWFTEFLSHRFDNSKLVAYVSVVLAMLALVSARRAQAPRDLANAVT
jgi:OFA family oxalate/formate antiporter-like MFS transporter